jgi:hypothetical protein
MLMPDNPAQFKQATKANRRNNHGRATERVYTTEK